MKDHLQYSLAFMELSDRISGIYKNSTPVFKIGDEEIMVADLIAAAVLSQTNTYLLGTRGEGKTLIAEIVQKSIMNGDALYLRGDKDLDLKGLMISLNLDGKTDEEIYQVSPSLKRPFFLVDELNRCIGLVQNQFLNIADGYVEIRGKKYYLGNEEGYSLMFATGNPPRNGDYTGVFDEDVALLDRIGLILNVDDYPVTEMDTADIREARVDKRKVPLGDMRELVFSAGKLLEEFSSSVSHYMEILSAYVYSRFLTMESGGREVNKRKVDDWRRLIVPGSHASGDVISQASDVSQRMVQEGRLSEALLLYRAGTLGEEGAQATELPLDPLGSIGLNDILDCYLETFMLNVRYDRRFLPFDFIREKYDGDAKAYLDEVNASLRGEIDPDVLNECAGHNKNAKECIVHGDTRSVQDTIEYLDSLGGKPVARMTARMLRQRREAKLREDRRAEQKKRLTRRA